LIFGFHILYFGFHILYLNHLYADARHWIGLTDEIIEGAWTWYKASSIASFTDWGAGQPNEGSVANCAAIWAGFKYQWVDEACTHLFKPLCERRLKTTFYSLI
jgi:hypothetical protein